MPHFIVNCTPSFVQPTATSLQGRREIVRSYFLQKPTAAKQSQALFSGGQHDGQTSPGVYTGFSPFVVLQKDSLAKHSQVWSGVCVML